MTEVDVYLQNRLDDTEWIVEATSNEQFLLWQKHHRNCNWEQTNLGVHFHLGELHGRPICMHLQWCKINGHVVMFWDGVSELFDRKMSDEYFEKMVGKKRTSATNFHICLNDCGTTFS